MNDIINSSGGHELETEVTTGTKWKSRKGKNKRMKEGEGDEV